MLVLFIIEAIAIRHEVSRARSAFSQKEEVLLTYFQTNEWSVTLKYHWISIPKGHGIIRYRILLMVV